MSDKQKAVVAMSGGVDSSVAAALLKEQGYDLVGVTMVLSCSSTSSDRGCCSFSAAADAKKIADQLGFSHYTINFKDEFKHLVIDNFIEEYRMGRTPNPCIRCNQFLKFDLLLKKAKELGAEFIATGHYARIIKAAPSPHPSNSKSNDWSITPSPIGRGTLNYNHQQKEAEGEGSYHLYKGKDQKKDQSYVLYTMNQEQLAHTLFPLEEMTKTEVRKLAKELKLPLAEKEESQEICFVEDDDYGRFIREAIPEAVKPGKIVDKNGKQVGEHEGIAFYTIGQRKGIGAHQGMPKYVIAIDRDQNRVVIGDQDDLMAKELIAEQVAFISGEIPATPLEVEAKIRYNSFAAKAMVNLEHGTRNIELRARVIFKEPQRAVTPGQSVVFYQGEEVIGGGIISREDK